MLTRITSDVPVNVARRLMSAMLGQPLAGDEPRHRRFEQASDVASLTGRENTLRRASSQQPRPLTPAGRVAQRS
jgi:hypothetical protein